MTSQTDTPAPIPIEATWTREVQHGDEDSVIVCSATADGRPIAVFVDPDEREALALTLLDPNGDDLDVADLRELRKRLAAFEQRAVLAGQDAERREDR
ncbi:hypothetical protein [Streptomyces sp. NPDC058268]|uniref:hypothetical protein n=1 Tax=Streptomyces sp. NPDC058268 TaxID=3346413 RepID=UPI0036E89BEE